MMKTVISLGRKSQQRIFVQKRDEAFVCPYWISKKGNLCWRIGATLYVKRRDGSTVMLRGGEWLPADATTKATAPAEREETLQDVKRFEFPDEL